MRIGIDYRPALKRNSRRRGIGRYTDQLVRAVIELSKTKDFLLYAIADGGFGGDLSVEVRRIFQISRPSRLNWMVDLLLLPRRVRLDRLDLFHAMDITSIPKSGSCPVWATVHDMIPYVFWDETRRRIPRDYAFALRLAWERIAASDRIITDSEYSKRDICSRMGVEPELVEVLYLGSSESIQPVEPSLAQSQLRRDYGIDAPFLFYVGGSDYRKNIPGLIDFFAKIKQEGYLGKLVVAGETFLWDIPEVVEVRERVGKSPFEEDVLFPGYVSDTDLSLFYSACEFFVFPSLYEGFGLPVLEGMKCGAPLLVSRTSSVPEVSGKCATYFEPGSLEDMVRAFWEARATPEQVLEKRKGGFKRATEFTWRRAATQLLASYERELSGL